MALGFASAKEFPARNNIMCNKTCSSSMQFLFNLQRSWLNRCGGICVQEGKHILDPHKRAICSVQGPGGCVWRRGNTCNPGLLSWAEKAQGHCLSMFPPKRLSGIKFKSKYYRKPWNKHYFLNTVKTINFPQLADLNANSQVLKHTLVYLLCIKHYSFKICILIYIVSLSFLLYLLFSC